MKHLRLVTLLVTSLVVMLLVAAQCAPAPAAPSGQPAQQATEQGAAQTEAPAAGEKVKIVYWSMFSEGEPLQQLLDQATKDFMAENPNIEVDIQWAGRQNLTQLQSALAAGTQVDIVDHSDDRVYNAIVVNDLALPMDKYLDEKAYDSDVAWKDTFVPSALEIGKAPDGHTYLIPRDDYISAFFYNVKMLDGMGIQPKASGMTWDEFTSMLDSIKTNDPKVSPLGADGNVPFYNNWWFTYLSIRLAGKDAFYEAAYDKTGDKWGAPEFLKAAQMIRDLQDKAYFQKGFEGSVWPAAQVQWVNGEIAMMFCGAWLPTEMAPQMPEGFEVNMFAFPEVQDGKGNQWVEHWANTYGVLKATKNPDAVALYLKYIMSPKVAAKIVELGTPVPLVEAPVPPALKYQYEILKTASAMPARAGLNTEIPDYMDNVFNVCDDKFFQMQLGPEEFINCLKTESNAFWAKQQ
jgi:raffinose/stachyose/melibiose transport system substrate-binding protein